MGLEVRRILAKAGTKLDEAWKWAKKGMWLFCLSYTAEAVVLLELIDDVLAEEGQGLEPDEETTYTALRTDIHNLMSEARRIGGNGHAKHRLSESEELGSGREFAQLAEHLMTRNRAS